MTIYENITLVIVCYNSDILIKKNLNEIKKFKTILVDNSNSKQTYELVKDIRNVKYIKCHKNLGYGAANNLGVSNCTTPYVLILNPDIIINSRPINILYDAYLKYDNAGILVPALYNELNIRRTNGSLSYRKKKKSNSKNIKKINNLAEGDTCYDYAIGCAFLIKTSFFYSIGGFHKDFFMYFEDNEICDRVYQNGKTVMEIPSSKMVHLQGLSSNINILLNYKLSIIHKISEYIYFKKRNNIISLILLLSKHAVDYFQRSLINFILFKFKKSFKNFLRLISIFLYITKLYFFIY